MQCPQEAGRGVCEVDGPLTERVATWVRESIGVVGIQLFQFFYEL